MLRNSIRLLLVLGFVGGAALGIYRYHWRQSTEAALQREQQRNAELRQIVQRLTSEQRVADVIVTDQRRTNGVLRTTLLFVEYARDGSSLPAKRFQIDGDTLHLDALVVKFEGKFVEQNDPLRGHSIALFTRLYGENQSPAQGYTIDSPGQVPEVYRGADTKVSSFEQELWRNFWRLADDSAYRQQMGVRVAQGEGVWRPFEPGRLYTLTLESNGGLNIRSEPLKGIYKDILDEHVAATSGT